MKAVEKIRCEIRDRYDKFEKYCRENNPEQLVKEFYTRDALMGGTGIPMTRGRDAIRDLVSGMVSTVADVRVEVVELRLGPDGDTAYDITNVNITLKDGNVAMDRACCVWRNTDEGWRVDVDWVIRG